MAAVTPQAIATPTSLDGLKADDGLRERWPRAPRDLWRCGLVAEGAALAARPGEAALGPLAEPSQPADDAGALDMRPLRSAQTQTPP